VHCEKKRPEYEQRHDKVILLHDNTQPHVAKVGKKYLETLKWDVLPHPPYSPLLLLILGCSEGRSTIWQVTDSHLSQKLAPKLVPLQRRVIFFEMEFENCLRDGKK